MAEREKVLYALNCRATDAPSTCAECSYYNAEWCCCNTKYIMKDTLELLKKQEPRVMTVEEIRNDYVEVFYFETRAGMLRGCVKELSDLPGSTIVYLVCGSDNDTYWRDFDAYGITWRAWTSRPTEAQRKAVKWDAEP